MSIQWICVHTMEVTGQCSLVANIFLNIFFGFLCITWFYHFTFGWTIPLNCFFNNDVCMVCFTQTPGGFEKAGTSKLSHLHYSRTLCIHFQNICPVWSRKVKLHVKCKRNASIQPVIAFHVQELWQGVYPWRGCLPSFITDHPDIQIICHYANEVQHTCQHILRFVVLHFTCYIK